jgi:ArsR family transcriptional regulator
MMRAILRLVPLPVCDKFRQQMKSPKPPRPHASLPDSALEMIAMRFKALAEPMRLRLLNTLMQGERTVSQLVESTGASQANVSKHLAILREAGIVAARRSGLTTICSIADPAIYQICDIMCSRLKADLLARASAFGA